MDRLKQRLGRPRTFVIVMVVAGSAALLASFLTAKVVGWIWQPLYLVPGWLVLGSIAWGGMQDDPWGDERDGGNP